MRTKEKQGQLGRSGFKKIVNYNKLYPAGQQDEGKEFQSEAVSGKKLEEYLRYLLWGTGKSSRGRM